MSNIEYYDIQNVAGRTISVYVIFSHLSYILNIIIFNIQRFYVPSEKRLPEHRNLCKIQKTHFIHFSQTFSHKINSSSIR